jgi:hypothetical protein
MASERVIKYDGNTEWLGEKYAEIAERHDGTAKMEYEQQTPAFV